MSLFGKSEYEEQQEKISALYEIRAELEKKVSAQEKIIELLKEEIDKPNSRFVYVPIPGPNDQRSYNENIGALGTNERLLFYFSRLREEAWQSYTSGSITGDECKGKLQLIETILRDSKRARNALEMSGITDEV
jgi:hypothetical protein